MPALKKNRARRGTRRFGRPCAVRLSHVNEALVRQCLERSKDELGVELSAGDIINWALCLLDRKGAKNVDLLAAVRLRQSIRRVHRRHEEDRNAVECPH